MAYIYVTKDRSKVTKMNCTFSTLYRIIQLELRNRFVLNTRLMEFCKDEHHTKYSEKFHSSYKYIKQCVGPSKFFLFEVLLIVLAQLALCTSSMHQTVQ